MAFCRPLARRSHKAASTFTPLGFSFSHIGGDTKPHVKHCQELQRLHKTGVSPYTDPTPRPAFDIVLWHEDNYPKDPGDLTDYLNDILSFALHLYQNEGIPTRMMLTLFNDTSLNNAVLPAIESVMASALSEGLTIGFQLSAYSNFTTTIPPVLTALKTLVTNLSPPSYLVSCDSEGFLCIDCCPCTTKYSPLAQAATLSDFATSIMNDIVRAGIPTKSKPMNIAVAGGSAGNSAWTPPLVNVFELYSQYTWNEIITSNTNAPAVAWNALKTSKTSKGLRAFPNQIDNSPTPSSSASYVPGWYAFSMECCSNCTQTSCSCLSSGYFPGKTNLCGAANVFGTNTGDPTKPSWTLSNFLEFLHVAAGDIKGTPTFVLYQSGLIPKTWLKEAQDPLNFLFA